MKASSKNSPPDQSGSPAAGSRVRLPPLKALLAFEAASRHGSFAQGAEELGVTPSAVSHHIQQLEDFLGVKLFQRHAGRAIPTSAGRRYAQEITHAFTIIAGATNLVAPQSQTRHLVIASGPSFAAKWLQPRLPQFLNANPGMRVRLSTLSDQSELDGSRFDIAIIYGKPDALQWDFEPLLTENLRPLCSPALIETLGIRTPKDLRKATLIHSVNALSWSDYLRRIGLPDLKTENELWIDRSTMAIDAAVNGMGIVLESEILAASELRNGTLIAPFADPGLSIATTSYYLVKAPHSGNAAQTTAFEKWLRNKIDMPDADNPA